MVDEPAPTGWPEMYIEIVGGVGAGFGNFRFSIYMVGEPAPTNCIYNYTKDGAIASNSSTEKGGA